MKRLLLVIVVLIAAGCTQYPTDNPPQTASTTTTTTKVQPRNYRQYDVPWNPIAFFCNGTTGVYVQTNGGQGAGQPTIEPNDPECQPG